MGMVKVAPDLEGAYQKEMMVGLSSWIIADGNYRHFKRGQRAGFALAFYPANSPLDIPRDWLSINPPGVDQTSMRHIEGSEYLVTAKVTHVLEDDSWWVIDAGVLMYRYGKPAEGIEPGCWVSGKFYVSIDPFDYFERLSRYYAAPPLIYDWDVTRIELETTPIVETGRMRMRDRSRRGWREVDDTKAKSGGFVDEFVLHCARLDNPPRR
jgi:hypothetical protein